MTLPAIASVVVFGIVNVTLTCGQQEREIGQPSSGWRDDTIFESVPSPIFFEARNFVSDDSTRSRIDISYRLPYSYFVFIEKGTRENGRTFAAHPEIAIEILNEQHISVAHRYFRKELRTVAPGSRSSSVAFLEGMCSFDLPPGEYTLVTEVNDLESSRRYFNDSTMIRAKNFSDSTLAISDVLFVHPSPDSAMSRSALLPFNYGGDVPFGTNFDGYFEVTSHTTVESLRIGYNLSRIRKIAETQEKFLVAHESIKPAPLTQSILLPDSARGSDRLYTRIQQDSRRVHSGIFHFTGDTLDLGLYELLLTVSSSDTVATVDQQFRVQWFDMPFSLRSLSLAIDALEYIATDDEMRHFRKGTPASRRILFEEFWKKRDTTPRTAFNEAMAEYYHRVDYSYESFRTVRQQNGVQTDRGKAYILYGAPATIDRQLPMNNSPRETWLYPNLQTKLVFVDDHRTGDYKLVSSESYRK